MTRGALAHAIDRAVFLPTFAWNLLRNRLLTRSRRWWDRVDGRVIVGGVPLPWDVDRLQREGVVAVVNLCEETEGPTDALRRAGIPVLRVPMHDFARPSADAVARALDVIDDATRAGGTAYVHCKAGKGRSATVALCWLLREHGLDPREADRVLRQRRPQVNRDLLDAGLLRAVWAPS